MRFYDDENYYYCQVNVGSGRSSEIYCGAILKEDYESVKNGIYKIINIQCLGRNRYYSVNSINITNISIYGKDDWLAVEFYD